MPDAVDAAVSARSIWSGTLSFGLVSIPVNLFSANRAQHVSLRMLAADGTPLARRYYDPDSDREVTREQIVRGYEIEKDEFVVVTDDELEALEPEKSRDIDLRRFVDRAALDPGFFERAYFLTPGGQSTKAYRLLAAVMERTDRAGIATFVMRTKEYLVAILAEGGILRAETLRFHDEIRQVDAIELPERPDVPAKRVREVRGAIEKLSRTSLDTGELHDDYADRLEALVQRKLEKGDDVVVAPVGTYEPDEEEGGAEVIDLMEVLKRSLRGAEPSAGGSRTGATRAGRSAGGRGGGSAALSHLTKAELYERAQRLDIRGRSSMGKDELIRAIRAVRRSA